MTKTIDEQIAQLTDRLAEVSARIEVIAQERQALGYDLHCGSDQAKAAARTQLGISRDELVRLGEQKETLAGAIAVLKQRAAEAARAVARTDALLRIKHVEELLTAVQGLTQQLDASWGKVEIGQAGGFRHVVGPKNPRQHRHALIFTQPRRVAGTGVDQMGGEERVHPIASTRLRQRLEREALQDHVAIGIADDALGDAIVPSMGVDQVIGRDPTRQRLDLMLGVPLFFGKETVLAGHDEPEAARASKQGRPDPGFGTGGPARLDAGRAGRLASLCFVHDPLLTTVSRSP